MPIRHRAAGPRSYVMDEPPTPRATSYLPHVAAATFTVAVCPTLVVWGLRSAGLVRSAAVSIVLGTLLALGASCLGSWFWKSRPGSGDVVFSDLML